MTIDSFSVDLVSAQLRFRRIVSRLRSKFSSSPLGGFTQGQVPTPFVDALSDDELQTLNSLLDWHCYTVDSHGRRFGQAAWSGKRADPQEIPDRRILMMDKRFGLSGTSVLEIGCFEGIHTVALTQLGAVVTATDARIENVIKTAVRCACFDVPATFRVWDVEKGSAGRNDLRSELVHHVGVLYHLADPVSHLLDLGDVATRGLMLDTHVARDSEATERYYSLGQDYLYRLYREAGLSDPFSGMRSHAKWLRLPDLVAILERGGFSDIDVVETREERNGLRVLLFANHS